MGNNTLEIKKIMRYLSGKNYLITTRKLIELHKEIARWNMTGITGAIIYGYPRTGKTKAITYLAKAFESDAGNNIPVVLWDITDHTPTEKNFYGSILKAIGLPEPSQRDTALVLKTRIVNTLTVVASETEMRTIILLIDEASELNIKDFIWLMDLYNALMHNDVLLITYMFGTYKLKAIKENLKSIGESQIVGRFMTKEYIFKGIFN